MDSLAGTPDSDDENTPKPLRIKMPQSPNPSSNPNPIRSHIPQRSSSFYFAHSVNPTNQFSVDLLSNPTPLIPSPMHSLALIVNKSRRSDTVSDPSCDASLSARRQLQRTLSSLSKEDKITSSIIVNPGERAGDDGLDSTEKWRRVIRVDPFPNNQRASIFTAPSCLTQSRKPTWSNDANDPEFVDTDCGTKTGRKASRLETYKQKFLHKVGLAYCTISSSDEDLTDRSRSTDQSLEAHHSCVERDLSGDCRSSTETHWTTESTIASFLDYPSPLSTPTRSSFTSRTAVTSVNSTPRTSSFSAARRTTCPVLAAKLYVTPELDCIVTDREGSMFVAVDVEAVVEQARSTRLGAPESALDLAIVIDNSSLTSAASLMTSCEAAYHLSSHLRFPQDRLAILTTNGYDGEHGPKIILPIGPIVTRRVREVIDTIAISTSKLECKKLDAIEAAIHLVMTSGPDNVGENSYHRPLRHVITFTPDSDTISASSHLDSSVGLHFVNPGLISWNLPVIPASRGWIISNNPSLPLSTIDHDYALHSKLKDMLVDLRQQYDYGKLTNVVVKIEPGYKCQLQAIMGETAFLELSPGETRTFLVKVQTDPLPDQSSRLLQFPSRSRTTSGAINLEKELENIVGNDHRTILSVLVQYENSLLPPGTVCSYRADARISENVRLLKGSDRFPASEATLTAATPIRNSAVQKRLISHIASHQHPQQALTTFVNDFGSPTNSMLCAAYLDSMVKELKHRARLHERIENVNDSSATADLRDDGTRDTANHGRPLGSPAIPTRCASSHQTGTIVHRPMSRPRGGVLSPTDNEDTDMARKIWLELRRNSRSVPHPQLSPGLRDERSIKSSSFPSHEWKRIQSIALSNKRSLGQDTMRSLSYAGAGTRASAPWL